MNNLTTYPQMRHNRLAQYESFSKILLIEDNPGDARLVEILLEESDFYECEIINKTTLGAGIEALEQDDFAAVLLDLTLPDSKGFETLEQLIEAKPDVNVIVMTGLAAKEIGIRAVQVGAQDFLVKGDFDADQLAKTLRYSIERNSVLQRLEEAQRIAHIGNWEYDTINEQFDLSDEVYRIFGYSAKEIVMDRETFVNHVYNDDYDIMLQSFQLAIENKPVKLDYRIVNKDNEVRYISVHSRPVLNKSEHVTRIYGIIQDITERKSAELELLKSQERYQSIFSQSKDAIYVSNGNGLVDFNDATVRLFGYSEEELKRIPVSNLYKDQDDKDRFNSLMETFSFVKDFEVELLRKDGTIKHCLLTSTAIKTEQFSGYHGIIRDITVRRHTEELRKAKEVAERSTQMKEKFLANVSHEMRTPMNGILGLTNILLKTPLDEEQANYLSSIRESSQHLLGIINDILEISSLKEGKINLEEKEIHLRDLVKNLVNIINFKVQEKDLELKVKIADNVDKVILGDSLRLQQILTNLAGNAVKFTEKGFIGIEINKVRENDDVVVLEFNVSDSGIGIPEDKIEVIFETFTRVFDAKKKTFGGTGLGLAITKQLVQLHGGNLKVESILGEGSTFSCEIPFKKVEAKPESIVAVEEEDHSLDIGRDVQILLVEDHKLNQIVARKTLEKEFSNVIVTIADNGQIAVNKLKENDYDLILMDIQMPVMDGYEATKYIREQMPQEKAKTTIFAMTAHAHMAQDEKYKEYGMDDCVLKPFEPKQLFSKIAYYINKNKNQVSSTKHEDMNNITLPKAEIDLSYMDLMADGDKDMKKVMLELLFEEPVQEIQSMYQMVKSNDLSGIKKVSHKMKSTLAFVGNNTLTETNKEIEQIAKTENNIEKLPNLIKILDKLYQAVLVQLKAEHKKL
ncbi:MAG: response regulator [Saprospiraceae bacterium]